MVRMYRGYRGFLLVRVGMRIYSLLDYMLDNALLGHLGDMSDCQYDSESEGVVLTLTSGYVCNALT
jgi:hypothetical protein